MMGVNVHVKKYNSVWYPYACRRYSGAFVAKGGLGLLMVVIDPIW